MASILWTQLSFVQLLLVISYTVSSSGDEPFNFDDITPSNSTYHHQARHIKPTTENGEDDHHMENHLFPIPSDGRGKDDRIIGGTEASAGRHPYTVALIDNNNILFCSGVLLSKDMVLTAAHCEKDFIRFVIGTENLSDGISGEKGETRLSEKEWVHPRYNAAMMDNDLMIYKLKRPARGVDLEVISVNDNPYVPSDAGERLVVLGWGDTNEDPNVVNISDELMKATVGYIPNAECRKRKGYVEGTFVSYENQINDSMLCALGAGKDGCQGDSGGPLISSNPRDGSKDVLIGLSSWGIACAHNVLPGVYSRVSYSYKWIKMIVCKNSDVPESSGFNCGRNTDAQDHINNSINTEEKNEGGNKNSISAKKKEKIRRRRKKRKKRKKKQMQQANKQTTSE